MGRRNWYSDHPRSCTCFWCNEGRRLAGQRRPLWRRLAPVRRQRPTTPLPDWMLEGLNADESIGNDIESRVVEEQSDLVKGGLKRILLWTMVIALAAAGGGLAATRLGAG